MSNVTSTIQNKLYSAVEVTKANGTQTSELRIVDLEKNTHTIIGELAFRTHAITRDADTGRIYYVETGVNGRVAYFDPNTQENKILENSTGLNTGLLKLAQHQDQNIYAIDGSSTNLYTIDPATGKATSLGAISGGTIEFSKGSGDIAFDPNNSDRLFVITTGETFYNLYSVDINSRQATLIGEVQNLAGVRLVGGNGSGSLGFANGKLYATSERNLYELNVNTAQATLVRSLGYISNDFATLPIDVPGVPTTPNPTTPSDILIPSTPSDTPTPSTPNPEIPPSDTPFFFNPEDSSSTSGRKPDCGCSKGQDLNGDKNHNKIRGTRNGDTIHGQGGRDLLRAGDCDDLVDGGRGKDRLWAGNGDDLLRGRRNADRLNGNDGADALHGNIGNDQLKGGRGDDLLFGGRGGDLLKGGDHGDVLRGGHGGDRLQGNRGSDRLLGGRHDDKLAGGRGKDRLFGNINHDTLWGNRGNDRLNGGRGNDNLNGGSGNDVLVGRAGEDVINGGRGRDRFVYTSLNEGVDQIVGFEVKRDRFDLRQVFDKLGLDGVADGFSYVRLGQVGADAHLQIDANGTQAGFNAKTIAVLQNFDANNFSRSNVIL